MWINSVFKKRINLGSVGQGSNQNIQFIDFIVITPYGIIILNHLQNIMHNDLIIF